MLQFLAFLSLVIVPCFANMPECSSNGFFRFPKDCTRFYRCVDLTGNGYFRAYTFSCPAGTVFDEEVLTCNFRWAAAPCNDAEESMDSADNDTEDNDEVDEINNTVIVTPMFDYQCTAPGFFAHESDCQRFWLCDQESTSLEASLYRCPEGYLFHNDVHRCVKAEEVECQSMPDYGRIAAGPVTIQLAESDLNLFYSKYYNYVLF